MLYTKGVIFFTLFPTRDRDCVAAQPTHGG